MVKNRKEVVVYLFYPSLNNPEQVLLLHKIRLDSKLHGKLVGVGGGIEPEDNGCIYTAARREIKEETHDLIEYSNLMHVCDVGKDLHVLVGNLEKVLFDKKFYSDQKEMVRLYSTNIHKHMPEYFLKGDIPMLDRFEKGTFN